MSSSVNSRRHAIWLLVLLVLFCLRVAGQMLVAFAGVTFLPPMEEWYSGLLPYPYLLPTQFIIIFLFAKICLDLFHGYGFFAIPRLRLGRFLQVFGTIYLLVMVIRYVLRMSLYPPERWTGGSIPIFFHWVLATYLLVWASFNKAAQLRAAPVKRTRRQLVGTSLFFLFVIVGMLLWMMYQLGPSLLAKKLGIRRSQYAVRSESMTMITSDGVKLVSDVYHPQRLRRAPTILVRIPYSKTFANGLRSKIVGRMWAERGYTVLIQSTRGRAPSTGAYYPLRGERKDGIETLAWIAKQPWFNGRIGMWGGSAFGYTEWAIADQTNPGPSSLLVYLSSTSFYRMFYPGGAFALESALNWAVRSHGTQDEPDWPSQSRLQPAYSGWPVLEADERAVGTKIDFFRDWLSHPENDSYWREIDGDNRAASIKAPALLMAGWFDPFLPGQLSDFDTIRRKATPEIASRTRLVIGPWAHAITVPLPNAPDVGNFRLATISSSIPWFDQTLAGASSDQAPVRIFVMGINQWRDEKDWPPARAQNRNLYLNSQGAANRLNGNGTLSFNMPTGKDSADHYDYDPQNPVPTAGGAMISNDAGVFRQNEVEMRPDVLVYTAPPFDEDTEITGPIKLMLYVSTGARSTDFTGKLVDVFPDGAAYNITDGVLRKSYAFGTQDADEIAIELWPTSYVLGKRHRLRLEVSSSNYPHFDRNPNTGRTISVETAPVTAHQTIYHDLKRPSHLVLPFISR